jgi:L-threonylcarbamoyladenylate synthase
VTAEMISAVAGEVRMFVAAASEGAAPESLPSPGVGLRHYAPRARLVLVQDEAEMQARVAELRGAGERVGVLLPSGWDLDADSAFAWGPWDDREVLARRLFAGLRELDESGVRAIVCPVPEGDGVAVALRDRLEKAARVK